MHIAYLHRIKTRKHAIIAYSSGFNINFFWSSSIRNWATMTLFCKRYPTAVYWHGLGVFPASEGLEREMSRGCVVDGHPQTPQVDHGTKVLAPLSPQNRTLVHVGILKLRNIKYSKCTNKINVHVDRTSINTGTSVCFWCLPIKYMHYHELMMDMNWCNSLIEDSIIIIYIQV